MPVSLSGSLELAASAAGGHSLPLSPPNSLPPTPPGCSPHSARGLSSHGKSRQTYFAFSFSFPDALFSSRNGRSCGVARGRRPEDVSLCRK